MFAAHCVAIWTHRRRDVPQDVSQDVSRDVLPGLQDVPLDVSHVSLILMRLTV